MKTNTFCLSLLFAILLQPLHAASASSLGDEGGDYASTLASAVSFARTALKSETPSSGSWVLTPFTLPNPTSASWLSSRADAMESLRLGTNVGTFAPIGAMAVADMNILLPDGGGKRLQVGFVRVSPTPFRLWDVSYELRSSDPANRLAFAGNFNGLDYHASRIGITAEGALITSGSGSQLVRALVYVGVAYPLDAVNNTALQTERNWYATNQPFSTLTTYRIVAGGQTNSASYTVPFYGRLAVTFVAEAQTNKVSTIRLGRLTITPQGESVAAGSIDLTGNYTPVLSGLSSLPSLPGFPQTKRFNTPSIALGQSLMVDLEITKSTGTGVYSFTANGSAVGATSHVSITGTYAGALQPETRLTIARAVGGVRIGIVGAPPGSYTLDVKRGSVATAPWEPLQLIQKGDDDITLSFSTTTNSPSLFRLRH